jgi:hypothetical protein
VNSVNLQAYVESYLEPAVRNANIMYVNKHVSERMWKIFFSDIIKAYLSKRTAVRRKDGTWTDFQPHVSESGTVYKIESIAEWTVRFWDWPRLARATKDFVNQQFQNGLEDCRLIFGCVQVVAESEFTDSGVAGASHPLACVLLVFPAAGEKRRLRLAGADYSLKQVLPTAPLTGADFFVAEETDSKVLRIRSGTARMTLRNSLPVLTRSAKDADTLFFMDKVSVAMGQFRVSLRLLRSVLVPKKAAAGTLDLAFVPLSLTRFVGSGEISPKGFRVLLSPASKGLAQSHPPPSWESPHRAAARSCSRWAPTTPPASGSCPTSRTSSSWSRPRSSPASGCCPPTAGR